MKRPKIFLSYSWENKKIADKIYYDLSFVGFDVIKDDHVLKYTDKISDFMEKIRESDFALLLISDSYLKSINCMAEVIQIHRDNNVWKKILPVICSDVHFYEILDRIHYVKYWQKKSAAIDTALKNLDPINVTSLFQELKGYKEITQSIDLFLLNLKVQLNVSPEELFDNFYRQLTERIGVDPDFSKMALLIPISFIPDPTLRLKTINNFVRENKIDNSYCYSILASCYRDLKQSEKAILYYKKAIVLDDFNYSAWNNLGQVYEFDIHNYKEAKKAYEKAISSKPDFDIPRLNLGNLLRGHFNDPGGAKAQFEVILKFDENNPKAHNNLANIYKDITIFDLDKAEYHLIIAVNQKNLEATLNYANFLKVFKKKIELGNSFYQKAKEMDKNNIYTELIDIMLKSVKG